MPSYDIEGEAFVTLDRSAFELEFEDRFDGPRLDPDRWIPHYLPHWSTPDRTAARHDVGRGLRLRIDANTPPWCPELDGDVRVSSIQTGTFAGPAGSSTGQHRFNPGAVVRTEQPMRVLYAPRFGLVELRCRAIADPRTMVALWMIGIEDVPERSGELCVAEIFGRDVEPARARIGMGIHPFGDLALIDDFAAVPVDIDATEPHTYSASWEPGLTRWFVDDRVVRTVNQAPVYPLQLMLSVYEFPVDGDERRPADYPKVFEVEWVRGYRRR